MCQCRLYSLLLLWEVRLSWLTHHIRPQPHVPLPALHDPLRQRLPPPTLTDGQRLHILLEIQVQELEDEVQLVAVGVHDVEQAHDGVVVHLFEQGDLADGGAGHAPVFGLQADLLQRDDAVVRGREVAGFVDDAVGACVGDGSVN